MRLELKLAGVLAVTLIVLIILIAMSNMMQEEPFIPPWPPDDEPITPPPLPGDDGSELQFESTEGSCPIHQQSATIELEGSNIIVSGFVTTPNPCYKLSAQKTLKSGNQLTIIIRKEPIGEICKMCIGEVPFSGKITGLEAGTYNVKIKTEELTLLAQETITISAPPMPPGYSCETVDDCKRIEPLVHLACLGYWVCASNECERKCGSPPESTCTSDSDCGTGGCSGQICGFKDDVEGIITTCEWREEYGCLRETSCGCVDGTCKWVENDEYLDCISSLQE